MAGTLRALGLQAAGANYENISRALRRLSIDTSHWTGKGHLRGTDWMGTSIPLELDHINGVRDNNSIENLRLICPNCHAHTPTYRGRNIKRRRK